MIFKAVPNLIDVLYLQ